VDHLPNAVTIIHTNDLHNHLKEPAVQRLRALKDEFEPNVLMLDAGDIIKTGNIGIPLSEEPAWKLAGLAGYDAITLGNREFHISEVGLKAKLKGTPCPILCANIHDKFGSPLPVQPFARFEVGKTIVIVLGLTVPMVTSTMKAQAISRYLFRNPIEAASDWAIKLRNKCDLLIALTHIGYKNDIKLSEAVPFFDVIIGGHSHTVIEHPEQVGTTSIAQTGFYAHSVGLIRISPTREVTGELLPLK